MVLHENTTVSPSSIDEIIFSFGVSLRINAPVGQILMHTPHPVHAVPSTEGTVSRVMASTPQIC